MNSSSNSNSRSADKPILSLPKRLFTLTSLPCFKSYRTNSNRKITQRHRNNRRSFDVETAAYNIANTPLVRQLKSRHIQMIAIGGSIGTGIFIESGAALATGGPVTLILAFLLLGVLLFCVMHALGEMAVAFPVAGSFSAFATRFIDPAWGFAFGWNYALQWTITFPLEIMSATIMLSHWNLPMPGWVSTTIVLVLIIIVNLFDVKVYGEIEYSLSILKVAALIGFILLGLVINCGGTQDTGYIGVQYWKNPGAFNNGLKGFCSVLGTALFSVAGTEMMALAAAETQNPAKAFPMAVKKSFWCISSLYMISVVLIGLLVPYDAPGLLLGDDIESKKSPFLIAIQSAGIKSLDSAMNLVVLLTVLSVANSSMYGATRTFAALAEQGQAPQIMAYIDKRGCPLVNVGIVSLFGLTAFMYETSHRHKIFHWLVNLSSISTIFAWFSICYSHIVFRRAWKYHGFHTSELIYLSPIGTPGSYIGLFLLCMIFISQFWTTIFPLGYSIQNKTEQILSFFCSYLTVLLMLVLYLGYKLCYRTWWVGVSKVDVVTGRNVWDSEMQRREWMGKRRDWPWWKVLCQAIF